MFIFDLMEKLEEIGVQSEMIDEGEDSTTVEFSIESEEKEDE